VSSIDFDLIIYLAWRIGFASIFLSVLLFWAVIAVRRHYDNKKKRAADFREIWEVILLESLDRIPNDLPPIDEKDHLTFLLLWNYLEELLLNESKQNLRILARRLDLLRITRRILRQRNLKSRLLAVNTLGWLKDKQSWDLLKRLLDHHDTIFSLAVARALIRINPQQSIWLILPLMAARKDWSVDNCTDLIRQIGVEEVSDKLILQIYRTPACWQPKMIRLLDLLPSEDADTVIKKMLEKHDDKEIIYACLTVYKDFADLPTVRNFLTHHDWEIRMQAAVCLGKYGTERDAKYLTEATTDTEWWVRYRSAQALAKIPSMTIQKLKELAEYHGNGFSHDVILRVATEREVAEACGLSY
jgi:HEAT repeat protein